jgi:hypothetical protein
LLKFEASGSLFLTQNKGGGDKKSPLPSLHPLPPVEERVLVNINVRDKFSDFNVQEINDENRKFLKIIHTGGQP